MTTHNAAFRILAVTACLYALPAALNPAHAQTTGSVPAAAQTDFGVKSLKYEEIIPGIEYARCELTDPILIYHVVRTDLSRNNLHLGVIRSSSRRGKGRDSVSDMAVNCDTNNPEPVAVINGDYFGNGIDGSWGINLQEGKLLFSPTGKSAFMIDKDGAPSIGMPTCKIAVQVGTSAEWHDVIGMNRTRDLDEYAGLHLFGNTKEFAEAPVMNGCAIIAAGLPSVDGVATGIITGVASDPPGKIDLPEKGLILVYNGNDDSLPGRLFRKGSQIKIRTTISPYAFEAIGGGPRIVESGQVKVAFDTENFGKGHRAYLKGKHPRAAVGLDMDQSMIFMVVAEGRKETSKGMLAEDLSRLMIELGAWDAMMFDGGASATLHTKKYTVTNNAKERNVFNGLAVFMTK